MAWKLAIVLVSLLAGDLAPDELIQRLDSTDRVVREEAARSLEEGDEATRSALSTAHERAADPALRERLSRLLDRLETRLLDRPTVMALDLAERTLDDAIAALSARSAVPLRLDDAALGQRPITVRTSAPLPFFEALDTVGRVGHVRHDPSPRPTGRTPTEPALVLIDGEPPVVTAYSGPLRIHVLEVLWQRALNFRSHSAPFTSEAQARNAPMTVVLQAFAEPGRFVDPDGVPRVEGKDDQGGVLAMPSRAAVLSVLTDRQPVVSGGLSLVQWHVALTGAPAANVAATRPTSGTIRELRGVLPVILSRRRPDPLVIPLADAAHKTFRHGGAVVQVTGVSTSGITLVLRNDEEEPPARKGDGPPVPTAKDDPLTELVRNRIEFEDADGKLLSWSHNPPFASPQSELRLTARIRGKAARLRVYRLYRLATALRFRFADVPVP